MDSSNNGPGRLDEPNVSVTSQGSRRNVTNRIPDVVRRFSVFPRPREGRNGTQRSPTYAVATYQGLGSAPVMGESFCNCPAVTQGRYRILDCSCGEEDTVFEWGWDTEVKSSASEISPDKYSVKFHVNYSCGTAAIRGNMPMPDGQYFWEIKMTTPVYGTDMMIGVGTKEVNLDAYKNHFCSLLGRDGESWGLSYLGRLHHKGLMQKYGSRFGHGSIIGVHLDMWMGTLSFYKNRVPMGIACGGLNGKVVYPMISSTAAQSGMKIIKARSFQTSLQFMCCQVLRQIIPSHLSVLEVLAVPPGLREFLDNNLSWLLKPSELSAKVNTENVDIADEAGSNTPVPVDESEDDDDEDDSGGDTTDPEDADFTFPLDFGSLNHSLCRDPTDGVVASTSREVATSGPCGLLMSQDLGSTNPDERKISIIEQAVPDDSEREPHSGESKNTKCSEATYASIHNTSTAVTTNDTTHTATSARNDEGELKASHRSPVKERDHTENSSCEKLIESDEDLEEQNEELGPCNKKRKLQS